MSQNSFHISQVEMFQSSCQEFESQQQQHNSFYKYYLFAILLRFVTHEPKKKKCCQRHHAIWCPLPQKGCDYNVITTKITPRFKFGGY